MTKRIITLASTKGGVGKTTLAANLGGWLATGYQQRVLLIDADPQPSLSSYFPLNFQAPGGLVELFQQNAWANVVSHTALANLHLVYSNDPNGSLQQWVKDAADGRFRLRLLLGQLTDYDVVLIDTQGAVGALQEAAILAADTLLSPLPPEALSVREFARGVAGVMRGLQGLTALGISLPVLQGVFYRVDRTRDAVAVMEVIRSAAQAGELGVMHLLEAVVPAGVVWREAASQRCLVTDLRGGATKEVLDSLLLALGLIPGGAA
ncbi:MAG: hypothetical protein BWK73_34535 [Thiothrix lacustris]|uniref:AAA domain-containing protein n=1 Tax=Thiothrix lacustris TaxID=525917 RepID=A0A1Y1QH08_9GAMM|nr:MAG: hypothetical protein BWK73_34535 [Thiothrix lacustris]